ncbi:hypothetical protein JOD55_000203 [Arcanobacterium pluranimalium]|uniref:hypothetical protein n=1 Tax=Arcanobacterium pluranimalium TaxID=108028 RepID=UPI00195A888A|nr:hypothetical protein [Arcanobacterium pluranimalium]MBM7824376.1 hypothetical protein [Arcanobacterium pluranimalium]
MNDLSSINDSLIDLINECNSRYPGFMHVNETTAKLSVWIQFTRCAVLTIHYGISRVIGCGIVPKNF